MELKDSSYGPLERMLKEAAVICFNATTYSERLNKSSITRQDKLRSLGSELNS